MDEKNKSNSLISYFSNIEKTFLIASLTFLGYLVAFIYKASYLDFYNIPILFTEVTLRDIIFSTSIVAITVFILTIIILILRSLKININKKPSLQVKYVEPSLRGDIMGSTIIFILLSFLIIKFLTFALIFKIIATIILFIIFAIIIFILPLYNFPNEKTIKEKFEKYYKKRIEKELLNFQKRTLREEKRSDLIEILFQPPYIDFSTTFIVILVVVILALLLGNSLASIKQDFYVLNQNNQTYLMADVYNNQFLLMSFDKDKKITTGNILILPLDNIENFTYENIGLLNTYKNEQKQ
jgi:hypothetical protein